MKVLVTGGAGFIGSTVVSACLDAGIEPVILDDFSTGRPEFVRGLPVYGGDVRDPALLARVFGEHPDLHAVLHFAARIVVPESVADPAAYYGTNVGGTIALATAMARHGVTRLVFSSSASIYGPVDEPGRFEVDEHSRIAPSSPYAATKAMAERILADTAAAGRLQAVSLRYFNPVGADPQGRTGLQLARPSHALGMLLHAHLTGGTFTVTGTDWPTRDGSGIRDYIHVWDLARAHVEALLRFDDVVADGPQSPGYQAINLGTGTGLTVHELVAAFRRATDSTVEVRTGPRRPGDVAGCYAGRARAGRLLGWKPELSTEQAVTDALDWTARWRARLG